MKENKNPSSNSFPELSIIRILNDVTDPRSKASVNYRHPISTILFIAVVCSLCGSNDWETIVVQANAMKDWLACFVDVSQGIPCPRTFKRVFNILNPKELNRVLARIAKDIGVKEEGGIVSFDGKTMRGTSASEKSLKAIHMLNAWSHDQGICLGHMKVDDKSNEILAVPKLMELLDLKGTIITADAMNTQKNTVSKAIELGADYVLPIKENQRGLLEDVELLFRDAEKHDFRGFDADHFKTIEKGHGRVEIRNYIAIDASELSYAADWKGFQTAGKVTRERTYQGKTNTETHYYISSCEIDAQLLEKVVRGHWGIENSLHLVLDITFREDHLRYRDRIGAQNLATIRKITLAALARDKTLKCGKSGKRIAAATDSKYREKLLKFIF